MSEKSMSEIRAERRAALDAKEKFREKKASDIAQMFNGCTLSDANAILEIVWRNLTAASIVTFECN